MNSYGDILRRLIKFSDMKMSTAADIAGYDISYISKWCSKSKLPTSRVAGTVNNSMAAAFAREIIKNNDVERFCNEFSANVNDEQLEAHIVFMLNSAFKNSLSSNEGQLKKSSAFHTRVLTRRYEIIDYFTRELPSMLYESAEPVEILCTMDICSFLQKSPLEDELNPKMTSPIKIRIGINTSELSKQDYLPLYSFISKFHFISFDFYDNSSFKNQNLIVVKDKAVILCSVNHSDVTMAVVITGPEKVAEIYEKTLPYFKINHLLIMATTAKEMMQTGYRSNFYAYGDFQMFLARGCEFFLPLDSADSLIKSSYAQGFDEYMEKFFRKLLVTWDDIFQNERADFFILKSTLLKYIEDGELYFTDVLHKMSLEERKAHINNVLNSYTKNKNLNFYIIDEEKISYSTSLINFSMFNNHKKLFLKNIRRFYTDFGPQFYSILNETLINDISECMDSLKSHECITKYAAESLPDFMERYGGMIYKILSLSELNDFCM